MALKRSLSGILGVFLLLFTGCGTSRLHWDEEKYRWTIGEWRSPDVRYIRASELKDGQSETKPSIYRSKYLRDEPNDSPDLSGKLNPNNNPNSRSAPAEEYRLGEHDILRISVFSRGDLSRTVEIRDDGMISFPLVGNLQAAGLTVPELQLVMTKRLEAFMRKPQVDIQIKEYSSQKVFVLGEVGVTLPDEYPGYVPLKGRTTVLEAISMAGGLKPDADLRGTYIIRHQEIIPIDLYRLINEGDLGQNIDLEPKDTLYIPGLRDKVVYVVGEVNKPRLVPVGLEGLNVSEAIAQSGDFKITARKGDIKVIRGTLKQPTVISVNFNKILQGDPHENIQLYAGDIVFAPASILGEWNKIIRLLSPSLNSVLLGANVVHLFGN